LDYKFVPAGRGEDAIAKSQRVNVASIQKEKMFS